MPGKRKFKKVPKTRGGVPKKYVRGSKKGTRFHRLGKIRST